jgi:hypothetical protein
MKKTIDELDQIIQEYSKKIGTIPESELSAKPLPSKWSKKEVVGHLIDSAQNNLRRFICGQYESYPPKIVYDQDRWVASNNYGQMDSKEIIEFWKLTNKRIIAVLSQMPSTNYSLNCDTGTGVVKLHSIEWLADDYVKHMKHHLNQIIPNSFDITYS